MKKLSLLLACITLASCTQNNEEFQNEIKTQKLEYRFQDGTTAKIEIDKYNNVINKDSESYKKIIAFVEKYPNFNLYEDSSHVGLLSPDYESMIAFTNKNENNQKGVVNQVCNGWFKLYDNTDYTGLLYENSTNQNTDYAFPNLASMGLANNISSMRVNNSVVTLYLSSNFTMLPTYATPTYSLGATGATVESNLLLKTVLVRVNTAIFPAGNWSDRAKSLRATHICYVEA
ncbi:hypothetical protein [uncultured Chryseobacterium sp.]|uniref:hypothetical protein n=1 Tax=uncultured Chryseobacterium sp. TaxID=259322 RepID=UPI00258E519D|nr:hypothetical protein [uncultured Chryseobacterium sp.]